MLTYTRPVRFEEVDAARILFFARFFSYAHEAMEHFFSSVEGQYSGLILKREVGFPAVHIDCSFSAPLRYGDIVSIDTTCAKLGKRSAVLKYVFRRQDDVVCATIRHTVVTCDLLRLQSIDMPPDVLAAFLAHLEEE